MRTNTSTLFFFIFAIICTLFACSPKIKKTTDGLPLIALHEENQIDDPFKILEKSEPIFLLTKSDESLFTRLDKMIVVDDTLIVSDKRNQKLLVFDINGNFIHSLQKLGKGPGEYGNLGDFTYQDGITIFDPITQQIHQYSTKGEWIKSKKYPAYASGTAFETNGHATLFYRNAMLFFTPGKSYNFASFQNDSLDQILDSASYISEELAKKEIFTGNPFFKFGDEIFALPPFEDVIYSMNTKGSIDSVYFIDIPKGLRLTDEAEWPNLSAQKGNIQKAMEEFKSIHFYGSLKVNEAFVIFGFRKNNSHYYCIYHRKTGKTQYFESKKLLNNESLQLSLAYLDSNQLYFLLNGDRDQMSQWLGQEINEEVGQVILRMRIKEVL